MPKFELGNIPWTKGKPRSDEVKKKISEKLRGRVSPNKGKRTGIPPKNGFKKGDKTNLGRRFTSEHRKKLSNVHAGRKQPWVAARIGSKNPFWKGGKKLFRLRARCKRRLLGYAPLNATFEGSEAHHIDREHVVFIPKELHRSVWHSLDKLETMEKINTKVFCWLLGYS